MRCVSTCLVSNKTKVNMCVWGRMPVSMVQSWCDIHTYIIIIIMRQDHQLPAQFGLHVVASTYIYSHQV